MYVCCMQTRDTTVHRFVVEKSVEQNVHRICSARVAAMDMRGSSKAMETPLTVRYILPHLHCTVTWMKGQQYAAPLTHRGPSAFGSSKSSNLVCSTFCQSRRALVIQMHWEPDACEARGTTPA